MIGLYVFSGRLGIDAYLKLGELSLQGVVRWPRGSQHASDERIA